jgi:hypothetical protein
VHLCSGPGSAERRGQSRRSVSQAGIPASRARKAPARSVEECDVLALQAVANAPLLPGCLLLSDYVRNSSVSGAQSVAQVLILSGARQTSEITEAIGWPVRIKSKFTVNATKYRRLQDGIDERRAKEYPPKESARGDQPRTVFNGLVGARDPGTRTTRGWVLFVPALAASGDLLTGPVFLH